MTSSVAILVNLPNSHTCPLWSCAFGKTTYVRIYRFGFFSIFFLSVAVALKKQFILSDLVICVLLLQVQKDKGTATTLPGSFSDNAWGRNASSLLLLTCRAHKAKAYHTPHFPNTWHSKRAFAFPRNRWAGPATLLIPLLLCLSFIAQCG